MTIIIGIIYLEGDLNRKKYRFQFLAFFDLFINSKITENQNQLFFCSDSTSWKIIRGRWMANFGVDIYTRDAKTQWPNDAKNLILV